MRSGSGGPWVRARPTTGSRGTSQGRSPFRDRSERDRGPERRARTSAVMANITRHAPGSHKERPPFTFLCRMSTHCGRYTAYTAADREEGMALAASYPPPLPRGVPVANICRYKPIRWALGTSMFTVERKVVRSGGHRIMRCGGGGLSADCGPIYGAILARVSFSQVMDVLLQ